MDPHLFFIFGPALILLALVVAFLGLRYDTFPASKAVMAGALALFVCLVAATTTLAATLHRSTG